MGNLFFFTLFLIMLYDLQTAWQLRRMQGRAKSKIGIT
jgi:hypothetical protein